MLSPFPGMNPFLEQDDAWHDFHERFIPLVAETIEPQVGPEYIVKIDEHVYIHDLPSRERQFLGRPDVSVAKQSAGIPLVSGTAILEPPAQVLLPVVDLEGLSYIEIQDRHDRQVVTVIELLSPANKAPGPDRDQYIGKRRQYLTSPAHFVEIDLLRGGHRMPMEKLLPCDYCVLVSRVEKRPEADCWPISLRERLPEIPIPLRAPDPDAKIDLQGLLNRVYDAANYQKYVYEGSPSPPLSPDDTAWAKQFLPKS